MNYINEFFKNEHLNVTIYHHYDMDGYASSAIIKALHYRNKVTCVEVRHGLKPIDLSIVDTRINNIVYILDYNIPNNECDALENFITKNPDIPIIVIDHHSASIYNEADVYPYLNQVIKKFGVLSVEVSATVLCYLFRSTIVNCYYQGFNENEVVLQEIQRIPEIISNHKKVIFDDLPIWIQLVNSHDTHNDYINGSDAFNLACIANGLDYIFHNRFYNFIIHDELDDEINLYCTNMITSGIMIKTYQNKINENVMKNAFPVTLHLYFTKELDPGNKLQIDRLGRPRLSCDCLCVNGYGNSNMFGELIDNYDAVIIYHYNGSSDNYIYNIYSKDNGIDCYLVASFFREKYGISGGGHKHAAGWVSPKLLFTSNKYGESIYIYSLT